MTEFYDMLGKLLVPGQKAINIFINNKSNGEPIGHRLCEIIKINPRSIRIKYIKKNGFFRESNIYNTTNRLIILKESDGHIAGENIVKNRWEILDLRDEEKKHKKHIS